MIRANFQIIMPNEYLKRTKIKLEEILKSAQVITGAAITFNAQVDEVICPMQQSNIQRHIWLFYYSNLNTISLYFSFFVIQIM